MSITGMSIFTTNYGSVIDALNSNVHLSKYANVTFNNNVGSRGAAIKLLGNGYLYFIGGAVVNFTNNQAQKFDWAIYTSSGIIGLGFPLCFYNGMTKLWKAGLCLLFPFYLLIIVVVIIIINQFSVRLFNRVAHSSVVQVLVTVIYFSFSKLVLAVINVFSSAVIWTENTSYNVWYRDGSVEYSVGSHCILMIMTLLVVIPLLLPYILTH